MCCWVLLCGTAVKAFTRCPSQRIFHYLAFAGKCRALLGVHQTGLLPRMMEEEDDAGDGVGLSSVTGVASLSYLTMAAGMGYTTVHGRQLFFVRYIDW